MGLFDVRGLFCYDRSLAKEARHAFSASHWSDFPGERSRGDELAAFLLVAVYPGSARRDPLRFVAGTGVSDACEPVSPKNSRQNL